MNKAEQIEEAIEVLGLQVKALNDELKTLEFEEDKEAYEFDISIKTLAIESLQQSLEREKNKELTKEDLLQMLDEFVFVKYKNGNIFCDKIKYVDSSYSGFVHFTNIGAVFNISLFKFYKYEPKEDE